MYIYTYTYINMYIYIYIYLSCIYNIYQIGYICIQNKCKFEFDLY